MARVIGTAGGTASSVEAPQLIFIERTPWRWALAGMCAAACIAASGTALGQTPWARWPAFTVSLIGIVWLMAGAVGLAPAVGRWLGTRLPWVSAGADIGLAYGTGWMLGVLTGSLPVPWRSQTGIASACMFLGIAAWRVRGAVIGVRRLRAGIRGEREAIRALSRLPDTYAVLADLRLPGADGDLEIDGVVLGPTGVFVLETKRWRGEITPGRETWTHAGHHGLVSHPNPLVHLHRGRWRVGKALGIDPEEVVPILVLVGGRLTQSVSIRVESPASMVEAIKEAPSRWPLAISQHDAAQALLAAGQ